jgi:hypothetical protein
MNKKEINVVGTLDIAFKAANDACNDYLKKFPDNWFPCGFAWVVLPGRGPITTALKNSFTGSKRGNKGYPKGWHIWDPACSGTQCMEAKFAGASAFAKVLTDAGYDCYADCRMD